MGQPLFVCSNNRTMYAMRFNGIFKAKHEFQKKTKQNIRIFGHKFFFQTVQWKLTQQMYTKPNIAHFKKKGEALLVICEKVFMPPKNHNWEDREGGRGVCLCLCVFLRRDTHYIAYFAVHSLAVASCWVLLFVSICWIKQGGEKGGHIISTKIKEGIYLLA